MTTTTLLERVGGREGVRAIVDDFYRRVENDPAIRPVYPVDLEPGREKLRLFMEQWMGGSPVYSEKYGHPRLRRRHFPFVIEDRHAGIWLRYMRQAMIENGVSEDDVRTIFEAWAPLAKHMVNASEDVPREPLSDTYLT